MSGYYRLYFTDCDGRIQSVVELECNGDAEAIRQATRHSAGRSMELWERARMVKAWRSKAGVARPKHMSFRATGT
jgi:hypothetical protein